MRKDGIRHSLTQKAIALISFLSITIGTNANDLIKDLNYIIRLGYSIGGTMPIGMPATIRSMNSYEIQPNFALAFDVQKEFWGDWGLLMGVRIEGKGMKVDATVKNYHMAMVKGGDRLEGYYTGNLVTEVEQGMLTIPIQATYKVNSNLKLKLGPYVSYLSTKKFSGYVYDGYLRHMTPIGDKINIGNTEKTRGDYDFSEDMRHFQFGIDAGIDWQIYKRWGAYADLQWGVSGVHKSSFKTIEQTLYPIFGTVGIIFKLNN